MEEIKSLNSLSISNNIITTVVYQQSSPTLISLEQLQQLQSLKGLHSHTLPESNWSFTQGLLVGQFSVIIVIGIFIKFFVFAESTRQQTVPSSLISKKSTSSGVIVKRENDPNSYSSTSVILEKTYYDVKNHAPESLDWFNVLIAQTINQFRIEAILSDNIYHSLDNFLATSNLPDYIDKIKLTEIDVGDDFPIFSNCRIQHSDDNGRLAAKIDVDLSDTLTLGIETKLLLNHPRPLTAVLPIELSVSIVRFSGCLTVSLVNTNDQDFIDSQLNSNITKPVDKGGPNQGTHSNDNSIGSDDSQKLPNGTALMFSFSPDYRLEFNVKSLIGARSKLQDIPKISSLIDSTLRNWFIERCIEPRFQVVKLPSLWPRKKNTREPAGTGSKDRSDAQSSPGSVSQED